MSTVLETLLRTKEDASLRAACKCCGEKILEEIVTSGEGVPIPHRVVMGAFVQFTHPKSGVPFGPWWGFCAKCVLSGKATFPLDLPEVQAAFKRLVKGLNSPGLPINQYSALTITTRS